MAGVYTTRIALAAYATSTDVYTVPTGKRLIVRNFSARNTHASATGRSGFADNTSTTIIPVISPTLAAGDSWSWEGRVVFDAGAVVRVVVTGASITYHVSIAGYLFNNP